MLAVLGSWLGLEIGQELGGYEDKKPLYIIGGVVVAYVVAKKMRWI